MALILFGFSGSMERSREYMLLKRPGVRKRKMLPALMVMANPRGTGMSSMLRNSPRLAFLPPTL